MQLSKNTIEILKNFSTINPNILFVKGKEIRTKSVMSSIFAKAKIEEEIPCRFAIYSLPELLGVLSLFDKPDIEFEQDHLLIKEGKTKLKYYYSSEQIIVAPPMDKDIVLPSVDAKITLTQSEFEKIQKSAGILKFDVIGISKEGIRAFVSKTSDSTSNVYTIANEVDTNSTEEVRIKIENLKMIPGTYEVEIHEKGISRFKNKDMEIEYIVALETKNS